MLYEIETDSFHKKIAVHLNLNQTSIRQSKEVNFSNRMIYLDLGLSYDFTQDQPLQFNPLEGLLAVCIL